MNALRITTQQLTLPTSREPVLVHTNLVDDPVLVGIYNEHHRYWLFPADPDVDTRHVRVRSWFRPGETVTITVVEKDSSKADLATLSSNVSLESMAKIINSVLHDVDLRDATLVVS